VDERGRVSVIRPEARDAVERELLDRCGSTEGARLSTLRPALMRSAPVQRYGDVLARRGLLLRPEDHRRRRRAALAHYAGCAAAFLVLRLGTPGTGSPASAPWGVPEALPVVAAVVCFLLTPGRSRISPAGRAWLGRHTVWWRNSDPAGAVAIGGVDAVRDTVLRHELRRAAGDRWGSSSSSSSSSSHLAGGSGGGSGVWCGTSGSGCGTSTGCGSGSGDGSGFGGCGGGGGCGSN
ncbi:MAG TPA: TIGR04222 domain-containing membrane protein, partial [Streptomyces sp.]|nr:TIGR04222 domain-containing membrane protein [Streptomyces sp.]